MATLEGWALTETHRQIQARLAADVVRELRRLWPMLDPSRLDATFPGYAQALANVIAARRLASSTVGLAYYERLRTLEGLSGGYTAVSAEPVEAATMRGTLALQGPIRMRQALERGADLDTARRLAFDATTRNAQRLILDGGRDAIFRTLDSDAKGYGYQRVTDGDPCAFCAMLASRGAVYKSEKTATIAKDGGEFHTGCGCTAKPFFEVDPVESVQIQRFQAIYEESKYGAATGNAYDFRRLYEGRADGRKIKRTGRSGKSRNGTNARTADAQKDYLPGGSKRLESVERQIKTCTETIRTLEAKAASGDPSAAAPLAWQRKRLAALKAERASLV